MIDDDAGIRVLVTRILERNDFTVEVARDGAEGIEKLSSADFGVIVLDLMMPRLDGVAVVKYLSQFCPEKLPNVIVTSAFGSAAFDKVCPPVHHFLEKPFDVALLVAQAIDCCRANVS
ncbi:MAG TPA: response regulator [Thermoanaerobaculia bacterium]|nr:response regulator [Thermoanaerobaculia bacterium]